MSTKKSHLSEYLVKNHKEFEWIQLYLFKKGFRWGNGDILYLNEETWFPKIFKVQDGFIYFINVDLENYSKSYVFKHVSVMMRKEKIKMLDKYIIKNMK